METRTITSPSQSRQFSNRFINFIFVGIAVSCITARCKAQTEAGPQVEAAAVSESVNASAIVEEFREAAIEKW
ncbi:MAG TPA: hypothetical protein DDW52_25160 [Planctomycetaceae bacterium]|nr:hypothetical protein [Planctomycetaceae bacterium]